MKAVLVREPELLQNLATGGNRRISPAEQRGNEALLVTIAALMVGLPFRRHNLKRRRVLSFYWQILMYSFGASAVRSFLSSPPTLGAP